MALDVGHTGEPAVRRDLGDAPFDLVHNGGELLVGQSEGIAPSEENALLLDGAALGGDDVELLDYLLHGQHVVGGAVVAASG